MTLGFPVACGMGGVVVVRLQISCQNKTKAQSLSWVGRKPTLKASHKGWASVRSAGAEQVRGGEAVASGL